MKKKNNLIFYLISVILITSCSKKAEESIYIIPNNYQGSVMIVFDVPNSTKKEYNTQNKRIYKIPKTGLLETEFTPNYGVTNSSPEFYYGNVNKKLDYFSASDWKKNHTNNKRIVVSNILIGKDKKDYLIFTVGSVDNDSIGNSSDIHRFLIKYFDNK